MHAPPHFQVTVRHFGAWRAAVSLTAVIAGCVMVAWLAAVPAIAIGWKAALLVLSGLASAASLHQAWTLRPVALRWDTQCWHLSATGVAPQAGWLSVHVDLGAWMLLRFVPSEPASWRRRSLWLPVQRRGHAASWHALRATVYCARPESLPSAAPF
jgi:hypothetical protein